MPKVQKTAKMPAKQEASVKSPVALKEEELIKYWEKNKIFEKSLEQRQKAPTFSFYDGPPFASGSPHYGHILASALKDTVTRYWTMRGYKVERTVGWDCHGLPVENLIEKEKGIKSKKDILALGKTETESITIFNNACRDSVFKCKDEWQETFRRIARWADFSVQYATLDNKYIETVWWAFKQLYEKDLVYKDYRVSPYCPRCGTPLSNFEVNQNYQKAKDPSIYFRLKIKGKDNEYFLVWTTTPWTLPANVALAVGAEIDYVKVKSGNDFYYLAKNRLPAAAKYLKLENEGDDVIHEILKGSDLLGWEYEPLYTFMPVDKKAYYVIGADYVSTDDGTGIVHIAPAFGVEDMEVGKKNDLPVLMTVDAEGKFIPEIKTWAGVFVKTADAGIMEDLKSRGVLLSEVNEKIEHEYPFCWRCDSPLIYFALDAWYVSVTKIQEDLVKNNVTKELIDPNGNKHNGIRWVPDHLKTGRFGKWLEGARDWNLSRNRFWGAPIPVWICESCGAKKVVGSMAELETELEDLHRPYIDNVKFKCQCGGEMKRVPEVFDCWFESGSMPYAQYHYPFENKEKFEAGFPADFIAEGLDQTRGWFYTLHVLATALFNQPAFKNVIVNGLILAADGKKLSKRLKNFTEPNILFDKVGVDAVRYYLLTSTPMGEDSRLDDRLVEETMRKTVMLLNNIYSFYALYEKTVEFDKELDIKKISNVLDRWILAKLNLLIKEMTEQMDVFDLTKAGRPILDFIDEFSTWYLRRSRDRFKGDDLEDKKQALATMYNVLLNLTKVCAPFLPFASDDLYQKLGGEKLSVHLADWPSFASTSSATEGEGLIIDEMILVRRIIEAGLAARAAAGVKVRQPLSSYSTSLTKKLAPELLDLIKDELNVKEVKFGEDKLDTEMTEDLKLEGNARELIRQINAQRKEAGLSIGDLVELVYATDSKELALTIEKFGEEIKKATLLKSFSVGKADIEVEINGQKILIKLIK